MSYQKLQASRAVLITPSDTVEIKSAITEKNRGCVLYVGTQGNLRVKTIGGDDILFTAFQGFLPVNVVQVYATNTTASAIIALW